MTLETFAAVVEELKGRNVPASLEYPGWISVETTCPDYLNFGDLDDTIAGALTDEIGTLLETFDSIIPRDTTDVKAVADFISYIYTSWQDVAPVMRFDGETK